MLIRNVALYWFVYEITGSAISLALLGLCESIPRLILGPLLGVLVDRYNRLRLLILVRFSTLIPTLVLVVLYFTDVVELWHILTLEVVRSIIGGISPSVSQSLIRELVPKDEITNAVALNSLAFNIARVMGPSLGGFLILWIGAGGCFLVSAATLVISATGIMLIHLPEKALQSGGGNLLREVNEGFRYIWHEPVILPSIGAAYILSAFVSSYQRFLPIFAKEILNVGPAGLGMLMSAPGVGAILALTFLANMSEEWRKETLLWAIVIISPTFLILFCMSNNFPLSVALLACVGVGQAGYRTLVRVVIQTRVPYAFLGRVFSVFQMDQGMRSVGSMVIGTFGTLFGMALGMTLSSVVSLALTSALFFRLSRTPWKDV